MKVILFIIVLLLLVTLLSVVTWYIYTIIISQQPLLVMKLLKTQKTKEKFLIFKDALKNGQIDNLVDAYFKLFITFDNNINKTISKLDIIIPVDDPRV